MKGTKVAIERLLTPAEVATMCNVEVNTVAGWARSGDLVPVGRTPGGRRRYRESDVRAFFAAGMPRLHANVGAARGRARAALEDWDAVALDGYGPHSVRAGDLAPDLAEALRHVVRLLDGVPT